MKEDGKKIMKKDRAKRREGMERGGGGPGRREGEGEKGSSFWGHVCVTNSALSTFPGKPEDDRRETRERKKAQRCPG